MYFSCQSQMQNQIVWKLNFTNTEKKNPKIQADMHDCIVYAAILITKYIAPSLINLKV